MARGHFRLTGLPGSKVVLRSDIPVWLPVPVGSMTGSGCCRTVTGLAWQGGRCRSQARRATGAEAARTTRTCERIRPRCERDFRRRSMWLAVAKCLATVGAERCSRLYVACRRQLMVPTWLTTQIRVCAHDWRGCRLANRESCAGPGVELIRSPPPSIRSCGRLRAVPGTAASGPLADAGVHVQDRRSGRGSVERGNPCTRLRRTFQGISGLWLRAGSPRK